MSEENKEVASFPKLDSRGRERIIEEFGVITKDYSDSELLYILPCWLRELSARGIVFAREEELQKISRQLTQ